MSNQSLVRGSGVVDCLGATGEHGRPHLLNLAVKVRAGDLELRMAACYHPARPKVTLHEPEVPLETVTLPTIGKQGCVVLAHQDVYLLRADPLQGPLW